MKEITAEYLEQNFDEVLEDVEKNKQHYQIKIDDTYVVLIPYESYEVLVDTYKTWVGDSTDDPEPQAQ